VGSAGKPRPAEELRQGGRQHLEPIGAACLANADGLVYDPQPVAPDKLAPCVALDSGKDGEDFDD